MGSPEPQAFTVEVSDAAVDDLKARISRTRFADDFANADWSYGVAGGYLRELVGYWLDGFDWRKTEAQINSFPHFRVELDGVPVHYVHVPGRGVPGGPAPLPLVLTHGWPWTFWDFHKMIGPLSDPAAHGGDPADAFDVVVPSLPGFTFSSPLRVPGINPVDIAKLWVRLMREILGYGPFCAQGGDWVRSSPGVSAMPMPMTCSVSTCRCLHSRLCTGTICGPRTTARARSTGTNGCGRGCGTPAAMSPSTPPIRRRWPGR
ncbi:epoxide hydrolase [Frankia sp. Cas3]|uniref:epoxide hydrolase family protein n=1 Tax=Frankia sp. Cas3 TaxID=3073926 RepID=UPI002AD3F1BC|nr:epoxide hydrolase [Frankia sp. Cas3]